MSAVTDTVPEAAALDIARAGNGHSLADQIARIRQESGLSHAAIVTAFARLARGPGKITFPDFVRLRLFDPAFTAGAVLSEFVGQRRNRDICVAVNYRHDWYGLMSDKVAVAAYLASYGFPAIPLAAIYAPDLGDGAAPVLASPGKLESWLTAPGRLPLFGKPVDGFQSLGSVGLRAWRATEREFETTDGRRLPLDRLLSDIEAHYRSGYIFQPLVRPHADVAALCGDRLACARIVTALTAEGARVIGACWKIPAGVNMADNYWRPGNLLAQVDAGTGRVLRATSGAGLDMRVHETHPDTNVPLPGFVIPQWAAMTALALRGARLMRHVPLIGWDIAPAESGPVIVEMNETPDFFLVQFAGRRGVLDAEFRAFMAFQAKNAAAHAKKMKADIAKL